MDACKTLSTLVAAAATLISAQAYGCTAEQRADLQNQIAETERNIDLNESAPPSSRSNEYPAMRGELKALDHAMGLCNDSIYNKQD
jgi:hypothetical protein